MHEQLTTKIKNLIITVSGVKWLFWGLVLATLTAALARGPKHETPSAVEPPVHADTFIPQGHVLIPIEIQNREALEAILGPFGVVDLFLPANSANGAPRKVATGVKLIRAPLDPNQFAVLVPEHETSQLVSVVTPFIVVIQNPKKTAMQFSHPTKKTKRIFIEEGN